MHVQRALGECDDGLDRVESPAREFEATDRAVSGQRSRKEKLRHDRDPADLFLGRPVNGTMISCGKAVHLVPA